MDMFYIFWRRVRSHDATEQENSLKTGRGTWHFLNVFLFVLPSWIETEIFHLDLKWLALFQGRCQSRREFAQIGSEQCRFTGPHFLYRGSWQRGPIGSARNLSDIAEITYFRRIHAFLYVLLNDFSFSMVTHCHSSTFSVCSPLYASRFDRLCLMNAPGL